MKSVELFTGAGGLAIGTAYAGFHHLALVERDKHSCHTIRENQHRRVSVVRDWRVHEMDVADFDFSTVDGEIDLLAGGPPCQPFSIGGRHGAYLDSRDMFPRFFQAVRELRPKAFLISSHDRPEMPARLKSHLERFGANLLGTMTAPWRTVRDAISDLPSPENVDLAASIPNHVYISGARSYPGHTGSPLDEPAKTLKAGVHGVPGGENMLALPSGEVRYFTVREAARLQTFPDDYYFPCTWGESMRQIGNAVPVTLAYVIASSICNHLQELTSGRKVVSRAGKL